MSTTIENEHPQAVLPPEEPPFLKRPLVSENPDTGETWYLFQFRFTHDNTVFASTIYARSDAEAQDIVDSMKQSATLDTRLSPIVRKASPEQPA